MKIKLPQEKSKPTQNTAQDADDHSVWKLIIITMYVLVKERFYMTERRQKCFRKKESLILIKTKLELYAADCI